MKRYAACAFIASYIGILSYGNLCHMLQFSVGAHPLMYMIVWDMFCGYATYAGDVHIIAEGESQKYYRLAPGPWGDFKPWGGNYSRHVYDPYFNHSSRLALNTLKHSQHEPIARILVIEESWPKKFDLPDHIWRMRYGDQPKNVKKYCKLKSEIAADGTITRMHPTWMTYQWMKQISTNPHLQASINRGKPLFIVNRQAGADSSSEPVNVTKSPYDGGSGFAGFGGISGVDAPAVP